LLKLYSLEIFTIIPMIMNSGDDINF
jgi:hypothetical protein